jgi:Glycosyltransferase
VKVDLSQN